MLRRIPLGGTMNLRDLGGYATASGGETRWRHTYRSACPQGLGAADLKYAKETLGITTVIDLRTAREAAAQPCAFAGVEGIDYENIELFNDYGMDVFGEVSYMMIAEHAPTMSRLFGKIAAADGGVLFHCTAGKDRTGVTAAILLKLAGVDELDIVADYQVSRTYIDPLIRELTVKFPEMPQHVGASPVEYIQGFLRRFNSRWSSAEDYLHDMGLSDGEIDRLRSRMIG